MIGAAAFAGCSAGQLSQTASQESAVDGNQAVIKDGENDIVALRNVRIQAQQNTDYLHPGARLDLTLVVINEKPDAADKLVEITSDIGNVTVTGDPSLPAGGTLFVGTEGGQNKKAAEALEAVEAAAFAKATVALDKPINNGPNYKFTFKFEKAGSVSVSVPVSAPEGQPLSAEHS